MGVVRLGALTACGKYKTFQVFFCQNGIEADKRYRKVGQTFNGIKLRMTYGLADALLPDIS